MPSKEYYVYILSNLTNTTLYVGVTSNLVRRVWEHKTGSQQGFTSKYKVTKLVYFEVFQTSYEAITREKQIKAGSRKKKIDLIEKDNKKWEELYEGIV